MSERNNIAIQNLSYVREVDNKNLLSGELDNLFNLTPPAPSYIRGGEKGEYSYIRGGVMEIIAMTIIGLFSYNAHATCTPAPDCASIGYTKTSCETKSVKCPFDTSKLFCVPCDSSYQYDCIGDNIVSGTGSSCGGKYASCECDTSLGYYFAKGVCACSDIIPTNCTVGAIYYADGRCSDDFVPCRNAIGVVVKDNELIMSLENPNPKWANDIVDIEALPHSYSQDFAMSDLDGKSNTAMIVAHYGEDTDISTNAALRCYNYTPTGLESSKGQWYLPAYGELHTYLNPNYSQIQTSIYKAGGYINTHYFWSSTETSQNEVWVLIAGSGIYHHGKHNKSSAGCFLSIK